MPALGLGTWKSAPGEVGAAVEAALRCGYRHIDCAAIYGNEPEVGEALARCFRDGIARREDLWITSKLWNDCHAPEDVVPALQRTLADLRLQQLDLYLIHWPVALTKGTPFPESADQMIPLDRLPIAETWRGMEQAVDDGLCRYLGVSNFSIAKLADLHERARIRPAVDQVEMHPYLPQRELVEWCRQHGVVVTAYSPLGSPDRPQNLKQKDEPRLLDDPAVAAIAERHGATAGQVLIAWALHRGTAVIPKSVHEKRIAENLAAAELQLTDDDMRRLDALATGHRYVSGTFWALPESGYTVANLWDE